MNFFTFAQENPADFAKILDNVHVPEACFSLTDLSKIHYQCLVH